MRRFPPWRRAYFLLCGQKKVAKEKATTGSVPGYARFPVLLGLLGGWLNSPAAQTMPADGPQQPCVARHLPRGLENHPGSTGVPHFCLFAWSTAAAYFPGCRLSQNVFWVPMWSAEQRRWAGGGRRGLSEGRRLEFRSRPARRVAQGSRRSRPRNLGSPFLWLLSFGEAKESTPARKAEP